MLLKYFLLINNRWISYNYAEDIGDNCVPNNEVNEGICTVLSECEEAIKSIRRKNYHQFQRCGFSGDQEVVCCPVPKNRFAPEPDENPSTTSNRIADRECQKISDAAIAPLGLHIIGGELASLGEFPHMVAIGFDRGNGLEFDCGGSLISNNYVLTAAHCIDTLDRIEPSMIRYGVVELGGNSFNSETDLRVAEIKTHPQYTRREKYHDLALMRLEKPVRFSSNVNAACLYTSDRDPTIPLTITGWGTTDTATEKRSNILLKANVTVVGRDRCGQSYANYRKLPRGVSAEQLCAGDPDGLRDTCQGDSGGPLQGVTSQDAQYRIVGITSFGRGCGTPVPGVYTKVSHYLDWIEGIVWPNSH